MALTHWHTQHDGTQYASLTQLLADFRQRLESEADGVPLHVLQVNPADLLGDLCAFLGLGQRQRDHILGASNTRYLEAVKAQRVSVITRH